MGGEEQLEKTGKAQLKKWGEYVSVIRRRQAYKTMLVASFVQGDNAVYQRIPEGLELSCEWQDGSPHQDSTSFPSWAKPGKETMRSIRGSPVLFATDTPQITLG